MASQTNKQPIFPLYPYTVTRHSSVEPINTLQSSIDSGKVEQLYSNDEVQGIIVNRIRVTLTQNDGETNTAMWIAVCLYDEGDQATWHVHETKFVNAVQALYSSGVAPASVVFEFEGGLCLDRKKIGIARSARSGGQDDLHITMEAGRYINDQ